MEQGSEFMLGMMAIMPDDMIIEIVEERLTEYKLDANKETAGKLGAILVALLAKLKIKMSGKNEMEAAFDMMQEMSETNQWQKLSPKNKENQS